MKLNNKGFAITTIIYGTLVIFLLLLASLLGILSTHKVRLQKLKEKTIEIIDPKELECTISYEKSSNNILRVESGRTDVSIRAGASTTTTRLASVDAGAEFPYIPSTESTNGCAGGWKKILYNKTTEAYICGTYTEVLDYSEETFTDKYYRIIDLKINASKTNGVTYSFDGKTYSTVNTLPTVTSGTHTAYVKDSNDEIKSCSIKIERKTEYRKEQYKSTSTKTNSSFDYRGDAPYSCNNYQSCSNVNTSALTYTCAICKSMSISVCPVDATGWGSCHEREIRTKTCEPSGAIVGYSEWTTDKLYKDCYNKIIIRTRYGAE